MIPNSNVTVILATCAVINFSNEIRSMFQMSFLIEVETGTNTSKTIDGKCNTWHMLIPPGLETFPQSSQNDSTISQNIY